MKNYEKKYQSEYDAIFSDNNTKMEDILKDIENYLVDPEERENIWTTYTKKPSDLNNGYYTASNTNTWGSYTPTPDPAFRKAAKTGKVPNSAIEQADGSFKARSTTGSLAYGNSDKLLHREDGPALIIAKYDESGDDKMYYFYYGEQASSVEQFCNEAWRKKVVAKVVL